MPVDQKGFLETMPFDYTIYKDSKIQIFYKSKPIMMVKGKVALKLEAKLQDRSDHDCQLILAKITGQFKMGNEK